MFTPPIPSKSVLKGLGPPPNTQTDLGTTFLIRIIAPTNHFLLINH